MKIAMSFFDFDEFLDVSPYANNIQEFLSNKRYENCTTLKINFYFYSDNELLYYDNRTLKERFTTALPGHSSNSVIISKIFNRILTLVDMKMRYAINLL